MPSQASPRTLPPYPVHPEFAEHFADWEVELRPLGSAALYFNARAKRLIFDVGRWLADRAGMEAYALCLRRLGHMPVGGRALTEQDERDAAGLAATLLDRAWPLLEDCPDPAKR